MKAEGSKLVKLAKGDILMREGERSKSLYWLQTGQLLVYKMHGTEQVHLGYVFSGELVGEMSFLDKEPRSATVKALSDCELIEIPQEKFDKFFDEQPRWLQVLIKTLSDRLRKANKRIRI
ncbi:MAG: Crp/Fnr family transcriptional regulator [Bacteriovoracia bacterium]